MTGRSAADGRGVRKTCPHRRQRTNENRSGTVSYSKSRPDASTEASLAPHTTQATSTSETVGCLESGRAASSPEDAVFNRDTMLPQVGELVLENGAITMPRDAGPEMMDRVVVVAQHEGREPRNVHDARPTKPIRWETHMGQPVDVPIEDA